MTTNNKPDSPEDTLHTLLIAGYPAEYERLFGSPEYGKQIGDRAVEIALTKLSEYYTNKFLERELGARIEEIEDIDQSRNVVEEDDGIIWCDSCAMVLETENDKCGCNHLYEQRKTRLAELRQAITNLNKAQLASEATDE